MSIKDLGYLDFFGTRCVYIQDEMDYILMPAEKGVSIQHHSLDENYLLTFSDRINKHCVVSVKKQTNCGGNHVRLELNYVFKGLSDEYIDGFIMKGNEIDEFFSPLEYYFRQKQHNDYCPKDLLYDQEVIREYQFECCGQKIQMELVYGNVLSSGIKSDLTIHSQLIVRFEKTKDTDFIYHVSSTIIKFLQLVHRKKAYNINNIELFHNTEKGISIIGYMFSSLYNKDKRAKAYIEGSFLLYKEKVNNILDIIAAEDSFPLSHLPFSSVDSYEYTSERLGAISSAFEYEFNKIGLDVSSSDPECLVIKNKLLDYINQIQCVNEESREFKKQAKNSISKIGSEAGLKTKIQIAYTQNIKALSSSLPLLLERMGTVEAVAKKFPRLRGKVMHHEAGYVFNNEDVECIQFIEILQYVMFLKRAGYSDEESEIILGALYYCNDSYMKQLLLEEGE